MSNVIPLREVEAASRALISARKTNLGIEVTMPVIYPDGQAVIVVVTVEGGDYVVHDAGLGVMYLTTAGIKFTKKLRERLASLATHYGCDFIAGRMTRRCNADQVALAIALVANASRTIGDQALEARRRTESEFRKTVTESLYEVAGKRVRSLSQVKGKSGRTYRVQNIILDQSQTTPVAFVEALAHRGSVADKYMEFDDLKRAYPNPARLAVYDHGVNLTRADISLLRVVSEPITLRKSRAKFKQLAA